jgi:hypothetical protein
MEYKTKEINWRRIKIDLSEYKKYWCPIHQVVHIFILNDNGEKVCPLCWNKLSEIID